MPKKIAPENLPFLNYIYSVCFKSDMVLKFEEGALKARLVCYLLLLLFIVIFLINICSKKLI
jgi:hypothetical protein